MISLRYVFLLTIVLGVICGPCVAAKPAILLATYHMSYAMETDYRHELQALGYEVGVCNYPHTDLSWNLLSQFNVLILDWWPPLAYTGNYNALLSKLPLIAQFMNAGGGVFVLYENGYDQYQAPNELLDDYGASILNEGVVDPTNEYMQEGYLNYYWARTGNITPHPVTAGISNIWYPVGYSGTRDRMTTALSLDSNWDVLVRGENSAYSYNDATGASTYTTTPPILAARSVGSGRMVAFPSHSTYTIISGHHPALQNITWSRGNGIIPSDVYQMFLNTYDWLAAPSLASGAMGGYVTPPDPVIPPLQCPAPHIGSAPSGTPHKVLAGVHSEYSDGTGTVAGWAAAAKAKGYSILIFAESLELMNETKWNQQKAECAAVSDSGFKAVAGIDYRNTIQSPTQNGERRIAFGLQQWFDPAWLTTDKTRVASDPGVIFGNNWCGVILTNPSTNALPPSYAKFYRAFALHTYVGNNPEESAFDLWLEAARDGYSQTPFVVRRMYSPSDVAQVTGPDLYSVASNLQSAYNNILPGAVGWGCYVSDGPRITDWHIDNDFWAPTDCGGLPGNQWVLHIGVNSDAPLAEVIVYDGPNVFRRFKTSDTSFSTAITGLHDKQRGFVLRVRDSLGREAVGCAYNTNSREYSTYMCADMQNTLNSGNVPNQDNTKMINYSIIGHYVTGWEGGKLGVLMGSEDLIPAGFDNTFGGFDFSTSHNLYTLSSGMTYGITRRILHHGSRDCCIIRNPYDHTFGPNGKVLPETEYAQTVADYVSYAAPIGGLNILRIDLTTTFKKACTFSTMTGLEASLLRIGLPSSSFSTYTYTKADGSKVTGVRNPSGISVSVAALQPKGYVALYPDFYGSCGVYALTRGLLFRIAGDVLTVGYDKGGQTVQAGTVWKNSVLLVRDAFGSYDLGNFDKIRSYFGSGGAPGFAPTMVSGTVAGGSFCPLELDAQSNRVEFNTSTASFPNDLPVMVRGLSEKSTACLFDLDKAELKPIGVTEGVGYTRFGTSTPRRIWIGNILIADNPDVWVELVDLDWQNPRIRLHNPTDSDIVTSVTGMLPVMSQTWNSVLVPSGTTIEVGGDNTPPTAPLIRDDGVSTTNHRMLHAFWVSIDPESGILGYRCAVGLTPTDTGEYVVPWTPLSPDTEANVSGEFQTGKTYYFYIKAYNGANMISSAVSDGILVKSSIISAKFEPDTTMVTLDNVVITAAFPSYQRYYAEEYDRAGAIALLGSATCSQGDEINASGQIRTAGGERILWLSILNVVSSDNPLPGPFALTNRELGGASSTLHQGVDGGVGPSNQAFLVRTWGRVVDAGLGYFKIDDGSCVPSYVGVDGLMVVHSYPNPNVGEFVCVTGISSVTKVNNVNYRALRTRSLTDLQVMY